jgi:hypothetical protein
VIISGHSHQPFARQVDGVWFLNPGSVGQIDEGEAKASYATLEIRPEAIHVDPHRVEYDLEPLIAVMREKSFPDILATTRGIGSSERE